MANASGIREAARLGAVERSGLLEPSSLNGVAAQVRAASESLDGATVLLTAVTAEHVVVAASAGALAPPAGFAAPHHHTRCSTVVEQAAPVVLADARAADGSALALADLGMVAYAGAPVVDGDGHVLGALCALAVDARPWAPLEVALLEALARAVGGELARRAERRAGELAGSALAAASESEAELVSLARAMPAAIWASGVHGETTFITGQWELMSGQSVDEALEVGMMQLVHADDRPAFSASWNAFVRDPSAEFRRDYRIVRSDGSVPWLRDVAHAVRDDAGTVTGFVGTTLDVSAERLVGERIEALADEQAALRRVAMAVAGRAEPAAIFALVAAEVARLLDAPGGAVTRFDGVGSGTVVGTWNVEGAPVIPAGDTLDMRLESSVSLVYRSGRARRMAAPAPDRGGTVLPFYGTRVAAPIVVGARVWGAVSAAAARGVAMPSDAELRLASFAELVALAIVEAEAREELRLRSAQQAAVLRLGQRALESSDLDELLAEAAREVATVLDAELASVLELMADGSELLVRAGSGWPAGVVGTTRLPAALADARALAVAAPLRAHGVTCGTAAVIRTADGPWGALAAHGVAPRSFGEHDVSFVGAVANVLTSAIERARREDAIRHEALHDALTGLANRPLLTDRLRHAIERNRRSPSRIAVLLVDLDHFKDVNAAHGHGVGDELLRQGARRLLEAMRPGDTVARVGGDEYALLCEDVDGEGGALAIAERVCERFAAPFLVEGNEIGATASVGVALAADDIDPSGLLRNAGAATSRAKALGRARFELWDERLQQAVRDRLQVARTLRHAVERDELRVLYQPVVSLADGAIDGFEALVRWQHPERGLLGPAEFIEVAEDSGLIDQIGGWVLAQACRQAATWNAAAPDARPLVIAVNLSAHQVVRPELPELVRAALAEWDVPPSQIAVEITESVLIEDTGASTRTLARLRELGVGVILDDFGTGYSSLSYLKRLPLDVVKLDRSFVADLGDDVAGAAIVASVVDMARALGLNVVAEGIETERQLASLQALGCGLGQGYYFARPLTADAATALLGLASPWRDRFPA